MGAGEYVGEARLLLVQALVRLVTKNTQKLARERGAERSESNRAEESAGPLRVGLGCLTVADMGGEEKRDEN